MTADAELTVWVVETHSGHGENASVLGVYESREAAWDGLHALPGITVYVDERGHLRGRPRDETAIGRTWAWGHPMPVRGRVGAVN